MTLENEKKLIEVITDICRLDVEASYINEILKNERCNIIEELGYDSLLMVELIVELEEVFDIEFDMNSLDINKLKYFCELRESIDSYMGV